MVSCYDPKGRIHADNCRRRVCGTRVCPLQDGPSLPLDHFLRRDPLLEPPGEPTGVPAEALKQPGVSYPMKEPKEETATRILRTLRGNLQYPWRRKILARLRLPPSVPDASHFLL